MLPFTPHKTDAHRSRYREAMRTLFHHEDIERGRQRPGQVPDNVFDWPDGLRLIIAREWCDHEFLHVSASIHVGSDSFRHLATVASETAAIAWLHFETMKRFHDISGENRELTFVGHSPDMVPHWRIEGT